MNTLRLLAPILLALAALSLAACGGGDDNASATTTPNAIGSTGASTGPSTAAGENWTVNGELSGTAVMTKVTCDKVAGSYQVSISGKLHDTDFTVNPVFPTTDVGTVTYGTDPGLFINVTYGTGSGLYHWNDGSGKTGSGTVDIDRAGTGSGSMQVIVPVSANSPGAAVTQLTLAGKWTCP